VSSWQGKFSRATVFACLALAGCGQALPAPPLSDIVSIPGGLLSSEQQQKAIQELNEKRATHETDVARRIEKAR
jgi:hypothetical protein